VSDNFYWRGNKRKDYSALNTLAKVNLKVTYKIVNFNGKTVITAEITNPPSSKSAAFGIRVQAVKSSTGDQILPAIMSDNYFSLMNGETKEVKIEFDSDLLTKNDEIKLIADPFNNHVAN
jgi:hypothetical protein